MADAADLRPVFKYRYHWTLQNVLLFLPCLIVEMKRWNFWAGFLTMALFFFKGNIGGQISKQVGVIKKKKRKQKTLHRFLIVVYVKGHLSEDFPLYICDFRQWELGSLKIKNKYIACFRVL